jgi:Fur family ferric uptake transcriptional regulator
MDAMEPIVRSLQRSGFRVTGPRRTVAGLIADQAGHFTAADVVAAARSRHVRVGRATIFRTLEALLEARAIERIDLPTGEHAYVACEPAHHHHLVCSRCGRTTDIDDAGLRTVVREVARRTGFRIDEHRLELFGFCPACQAAGPSPIRRSA